MRIEDDIKLDYCDVLLRPKRSTLSSREQVDLTRTFHFRTGSTWTGIPIVAANMDTVGTLEMAEIMCDNKMLTCLSKHTPILDRDWSYSVPYLNHMSVSMGMDDASTTKGENILREYEDIRFITLDVANGYTEKFVKFVSNVRSLYPTHTIIAGNVVTAEMTEALILAGADIVKIGIGPGSVCTTRKITGVGYPQLSAVIECADAAHGLGGHIMADGGCTTPGDIVKAFAGGADFVMLGGMLAGHNESGGDDVTDVDGVITHKTFYGMSSDTAMKKYNGGVADYRAAEGKTVTVPYKGDAQKTISEICGGLRSACTYIGADKIKDIPKCATFVRVNRQLNNIFNGNEI